MTVARQADPVEIARLIELADAGASARTIAKDIGRSQDFVWTWLRKIIPAEAGRRINRIGWPRRTTTMAQALCGRRYEDVDRFYIVREWPRPPINGNALASAMRLSPA